MGDEKARNFPAWILDVHYLPPGPSRPRAALDAIRQVFSLGSVFFADNLFTFGKSLEFLRDEKFTETFFAATTSLQDKALVWRKHTLYWAARRAMQLEGDFVEAGCYEGFTAQVLCNLLDLKAAGKQFWMYDRFDAPANEEYRLPEHSTSLHQRVIHRFADRPEVKSSKAICRDLWRPAGPKRFPCFTST